MPRPAGQTAAFWSGLLKAPNGARTVSRSLQTIGVVALILIVGLTAQQLWLGRTRAIDDAAMQMSRLDMVFAEQTGRAVETVDLILRGLADMAPDRVRDRPADVTAMLRRRIAGVRQLSDLGIADPSGAMVASSNADLLGPLPPAGVAALAIARVDPDAGVRITEPFRDVYNHWTAMVTRRLQTRDGQFAGIAIALLKLAYFEDFYEAVDLSENGAIMLHLRNGTVLARYPRSDDIVGLSFAKQAPFAGVLAHAQAGTVIMANPADGRMRIVAIRALKSFPLAVSVSVGEQEVLSAWWREVWIFLAAAVCGGLGLTGLLLYLSRQAREVAMTERLHTMQEIARVASLDALTGLLNRGTLTDRLDRLLAWAAAGHHQVALLFLDLDGFKQINDVQGHKAGDAVLRVIADRLARAAAPAEVARWGGDEFVIITPVRPPQTAEDPAEELLLAGSILRDVSQPIDIDGQIMRVGGTIGLATFPDDGRTPDALVGAADTAMYDGKQAGGNIVRVYDPALADAVAASAGLERDLRQALLLEAFELVYQPIIEMPGERCVAFEALLRWQHPTRGAIPPSDFIPAAEHCGLIGRLGRWVLGRACRDAMGWPQALAVSVNVSVAQAISGELLRDVGSALEHSGLPAARLHLELTESVVGAEHQRIVPVLQSLRALGAVIALDDFGTGFSSLSRLRHWPIDVVKIDKAFVRAMERDGTAVIRATLLVAREYGLGVTVEGVETVAQWRELARLGVHSFQGYLFSRPLAVSDVADWLGRVSQPARRRVNAFGWSKLEHSPLIEPSLPGG